MAVAILYFASVREAIGVAREEVSPPADVTTLAALIDWLAGQSPAHAAAFADRQRLRAAIDQDMASLDALISNAREIALFPPVTGG